MDQVKKLRFLGIAAGVLFFVSCASAAYNDTNYTITEAPASIREKIVLFAHKYAERDTEFLMGGRPYLEKNGKLGIDCSGLILRVCEYAVNGTKYSLLFTDVTVFTLYANFTSTIDKPGPGDFIFMSNGQTPTHVSIFIREDDDYIYFIDVTLKEADELYEAVNGASLRYYPKDDPRFLFFARLLVKH